MTSLTQRTRLVLLLAYLAVLVGASRFAFGSWIPETGTRGLWLFSGVAALLLGDLLVSPYFTKPVDALSYSIAALLALLSIEVWGDETLAAFGRFLWVLTVTFQGICIVTALGAIALKDAEGERSRRLGQSAYVIADNLGRPRWIFSAVFFFALIAYHRESPREYITITIAWGMTIGLQPLETVARTIQRLIRLWKAKEPGNVVGSVAGHQSPRVVLVRQHSRDAVLFGTPLYVRADDGGPGLAVSLDYVGFADGSWLRGLHLPLPRTARDNVGGVLRLADPDGCLALDPEGAVAETFLSNLEVWNDRHRILGLVAPDTSSSLLKIDLARTDLQLEEGRLVGVSIGKVTVLYQLIKGLTKEEILQQKNTRGYVLAEAKKVGRWDTDAGRFVQVKWIPHPNAPVFLVESEPGAPNPAAVGNFPRTSYPVSVDPHLLVTHNTAILGILGVGKSFLAIELVERLIASDIKVICLDLTNQYAAALNPFYDAATEGAILADLQAVGPPGRTHITKNVEEGGSINEFRDEVRDVVSEFLAAEDRPLLILNPAAFQVWRQDSKPFQQDASMATLTPCEVTRIVTEATLDILQEEGMTDSARCCLVYEEAHSLIPEWGAIASEGDRAATNGTAKAILQGRKFGLGAIVITQRTANVTKTILNQCNTVFAMRVYDATGMDFLSNYIGADYAGVLSTLEDRHAVVFGRASSCADPVLIRLNDRDDFVRVFRDAEEEGEVVDPHDIVERLMDDLGAQLVHGDEAVTSSIAETNATGFGLDEYEIISAEQSGDDWIEFKARLVLSGEHDSDKPFAGATIRLEVIGRVHNAGDGWRLQTYETKSVRSE